MRPPRLPPTRYGMREPAQQPAAEEVGHALRRLEEVDRVPRRRRVDDDQVVLAGRVDLEEPLHRDVVVALHEARGDVVVQPVLEDPVRGRLVGRVPQHELVPRLLRVEHRGPQLATRLDAGRGVAPRAARGASTLPNASSPSASASRFAGSIVSTSTLPPRRAAAASAAAAATDVLPTPPEPQNTTISFVASSCSSAWSAFDQRALAHRPSSCAERVGDHARDAQPVVADEQVRQ